MDQATSITPVCIPRVMHALARVWLAGRRHEVDGGILLAELRRGDALNIALAGK
jgi:hypothetical protein